MIGQLVYHDLIQKLIWETRKAYIKVRNRAAEVAYDIFATDRKGGSGQAGGVVEGGGGVGRVSILT